MLATALVLSVLGLLAGPALAALGRGRPLGEPILEGLTLGVLPALVLTRLLPHVYESLGWRALALCAAGFVALWLADRRSHRLGLRASSAVVLPALGIHALADGAALATALSAAGSAGAGAQQLQADALHAEVVRAQVTAAVQEHAHEHLHAHGHAEPAAGLLLAVALLLHRLPEGLFLARVFVPVLGLRAAFVRVFALALCTVVGALAQRAVLAHLPEAWIDGAVAVGLGGMLRLVLHSHAPAPATRAARAASGLAFLAGVVGVFALPSPDSVLARAQPRELSLVQSLGPLFIETAPSLLLGLALAGLVQGLLPRHLAGWLRSKHTLGQALRGLAFGAPLPLCSCGVLPMVRRLLLAGAPTAAVVAFAVGTPEIGPGAITLSLRLLGPRFTLVRLAAGTLTALGVALLVARAAGPGRFRAAVRSSAGRFVRRAPSHESDALEARPASRFERVRTAMRESFGSGLDHTAAWYVGGLVVAAVFEAAVRPLHAHASGGPTGVFSGAWWDVLASAALAVPLYVCAEGATPLAAVLVHKGFSVGAALAFLLVGPGTNIAVLGLLRGSLGRRAALSFALGSVGLAVLFGYAANALVPAASVPDMHPLVAHDHMYLEWVCAAALALLLVRSLLRMGPRGWFAQVSFRPSNGGSSDEHAHHTHETHETHDEEAPAANRTAAPTSTSPTKKSLSALRVSPALQGPRRQAPLNDRSVDESTQ